MRSSAILPADFQASMYPILTSPGTGRERLERGLTGLCDLLDRHLPLMLATDEAFHQETAPGEPPDYLHPFITFLRDAAADGSLDPGRRHRRLRPTSRSTRLPGRSCISADATSGPSSRPGHALVGVVLNGLGGRSAEQS